MTGPAHFSALEHVRLDAGPVHLAVGMFDGVHRGHQAVVGAAIRAARAAGGRAGVLTFAPHPSVVLRPERPTPLILPPAVKLGLLARLCVDFVVEHPFTAEFAATTAAGFVARLRSAFPGLRAVYAGENFRFGRGREGDVAFLRAAAAEAGFVVNGAPRLGHGDAPISSSRIRELLAAGEVATANALLGYSYFAEGVVRPGKRLGRTLGFPTLNVPWSPGLRPRLGVYAGFVSGADARPLPAVANYGLRPTVESGATEPRLEVHVLGATDLTEGDRIRFQWLEFLRPEQRFAAVGELRAQVERDREEARSRLVSARAQEFPNGT